MRHVPLIALLLCLAMPVYADDAAAAKAALELAKAKLLLSKEKAAAKELLSQPREVAPPLAEAKEKAKTSGKPLFVSTCETCVQTCGELRQLGDVVHVPKKGDQGFFRVQVWDNDGNWLYYDWDRLPSKAEAEAKSKELQGWIKKPPAKLPATTDFRISLPPVTSPAECVGST